MNKIVTKEIDLDGRKLKLETGYLATQADASVLASWGETVVLVTVANKPLSEDIGYFPLSVEYVEKYYAGGRITGQKFIKRETRPTEEAILNGRAIDRSIRPLFPKEFKNEVQIIITVLSYDGINDPMMLGFIGTSAALTISSVPWMGPLGVTRVGLKGEEMIFNPELTDFDNLDLELLVASSAQKVAMIEAEAKQIDDQKLFEALTKAHEHSQAVIKLIEDFASEAGKTKQEVVSLTQEVDEKILKEAKAEAKKRIEEALFNADKKWNEATGDLIKKELATQFKEGLNEVQIAALFDKVAKELMNETVLKQGKRVDGRAMGEVRPIDIQIGLLPRAHGSAVFQRGTTQVMSIATLGPLSLGQTLEGMTGESTKKFMHHYNMSINPFSTGEVKRIGSPNRRDIGHGALVEKGIKGVLPTDEEFPYAVRVVSEILGANASTSMASVCASTLSMLNAGVPLKNPVAGIAMGLLSGEDKFQVITDMQAVEDFYGEMDFKVTGTKDGITAIQMDTKLDGLTFEIIEEALKQGKKAREFILAKMAETLPQAGEISQYAPKIEIVHIDPQNIGQLIGPGGKNINALIAKTGAQIDIEDDGTVMVSSTSDESIKETISVIQGMFQTIEPGQVFEGKVVRLMPFGAFVELAPGKDGLVHVSQMAPGRVEKPEDIVEIGQTVKVRVTEVSPEGKVSLSMLFGADMKPESEGRPRGGGRSDGGERRPFGNRDGNRFGNRDRGSRPSGGRFDRRDRNR